jgi:hypothetical protein
VGSTPQGPDHTDERLAGTGLAALGSGDFEEAYQQVAAEDSERGSERARRSRTHASPPLSTPGEGGPGRDTRIHGPFGPTLHHRNLDQVVGHAADGCQPTVAPGTLYRQN